jgi:hypothetical protein
MSRRLLQAANALLGLATVALAGMSLALGAASPVYAGEGVPEIPALDGNLLFFGGMGLGLGLILLWITPSIERNTTLFRAVWICAPLGGIGRLVFMAVVGQPPVPMIVFTALEVPLVPVLLVWQSRVAARVG